MFRKKIIVLLLVIMCVWNCERDDICAESTPTTPRLIIEFKDVNNFENNKAVRQLTVIGIDEEGNDVNTLIARTNTDQIALPLRIIAEGVTNISQFKLIKDADFDADDNPDTSSNIDIITISYLPEFVFVSKACGLKSIFNSIGISTEDDDQNWVLATQLITENVENENNAHITIFH